MPSHQIHHRLTDETVRAVLRKYVDGELRAKDARRLLGLGKSRFYELAVAFRAYPKSETFTIAYARSMPTRTVDPAVEQRIREELEMDKRCIADNRIPLHRYNYTYVHRRITEQDGSEISYATIRRRALAAGYANLRRKRKVHDREVITHYVGELVQHDSSIHLFAPDAQRKWYLITSIDDYSRALLYADFVLAETTFAHIFAAQSVSVRYGFPHAYYVDSLRVFRYVKDPAVVSPASVAYTFTDDTATQWKRVMGDCGIQVIYALSPQAKGKVERPYEWLQDHVVRTCVREGITDIAEGRRILREEVIAYNAQRVHSTTGEIPSIRFRNAVRAGKTLFRPFKIPEPFRSVKDLFCVREERVVDAYRRISIKGTTLTVPDVLPRQAVEVRLYPDHDAGIVEVRFWYRKQFRGAQKLKMCDLPGFRF